MENRVRVKHETSLSRLLCPPQGPGPESWQEASPPTPGRRQGLVGAYDQAPTLAEPRPLTPALATFGPYSREGHGGSPRATRGAGLCPDAPELGSSWEGEGAGNCLRPKSLGPAQESHWPNLGDPIGGRGEGRTCRAGHGPHPWGPREQTPLCLVRRNRGWEEGRARDKGEN